MKLYNFSLKIGLAAFLLVFTVFTYVSVSAGSKSTLYSHNSNVSNSTQKSLAGKVIRFHVLANSDSTEDQALKLEVKSNVVDYIYDNTAEYTSLEETRDFLKSNCGQIEEIALNTIEENGYDYDVTAKLTYSDFPEKSYGDVTFPAGTYESFTITIGEGNGHNWWCVLYPPLCFVDASTGILPDSSKEMLKDELTEEEYDVICDDTDNDTENISDDDNVVFQFKYLTFLNNFIGTICSYI